jgi:cyclase
MLKTRVIPTLLMKNSALVKGVGFDSWRQIGTVLPAIKVYNMRDVDELILVDITATEEQRQIDYEELSLLSAECFIPLSVGGGVNSIDTIKNILRSGADKVVINSAAYRQPELIQQGAEKYGQQCIVAAIDVRKNQDGSYQCFSQSGCKAESIDPVSWAKKLEQLGAGEIIITAIERDGAMQGFDIGLINQVSSAVNVPVIASGGAGQAEDFLAAVTQGNATAIAAASIFHFTEITPREVKDYLAEQGIAVRR